MAITHCKGYKYNYNDKAIMTMHVPGCVHHITYMHDGKYLFGLAVRTISFIEGLKISRFTTQFRTTE